MYYWLQEGRTEEEWTTMRARLELPPAGYTGSLEGTVWDPDAILQTYQNEGW